MGIVLSSPSGISGLTNNVLTKGVTGGTSVQDSSVLDNGTGVTFTIPFNSCQDVGANDTYACSLSPAISAYATGVAYWFKANTANTGAATLNLNSLGAKTIKKNKDSDLSDADIKAGQWVHVVYDGTNFELLSPVSNAAGGVATWEIKSADFTAVAGHRYQVDTSAGVVIATLPASASVGDEIPIEDATLSWATHNLTLNRNGLKINGGTSNYTANVIGGKLSLVYISAAYGWSVK